MSPRMTKGCRTGNPVGCGKSDADVRKMLDWERRFVDRCDLEPLAKRAWYRLEGAGLGNACKRLLWEYAQGQEGLAEIQRGTALLIHNSRALERAMRQEQARASDPRAQMFRERREKAARVLDGTPWPFRNQRIATFSDAVRAYPSQDWSTLRRVRALITRSGPNFMLAILRAGARKRSVDLSGNEIAALVYCATGSGLDAGAVRRYLRQAWIAEAERDFQALVDRFSP